MEVSVSNQRPRYCIDCVHFVTPPYSAAECHAPGVPEGTTTKECRSEVSLCRPQAVLWEKNNARFEQII